MLFSFDCHTELTYKMFNNNKFIKTYVTSLENADTTNSNIGFNGYKLYVNGTAINKKMHCKGAFLYSRNLLLVGVNSVEDKYANY